MKNFILFIILVGVSGLLTGYIYADVFTGEQGILSFSRGGTDIDLNVKDKAYNLISIGKFKGLSLSEVMALPRLKPYLLTLLIEESEMLRGVMNSV